MERATILIGTFHPLAAHPDTWAGPGRQAECRGLLQGVQACLSGREHLLCAGPRLRCVC